MNKVILIGRLTRNPEVRYSQGEKPMAIARYTLAVDRPKRHSSETEQTADFISCKAFAGNGEFAEKYLQKGMKIAVSGRIQTGSYTNKDGIKIYTTEVIVENQEFVEPKKSQGEVSEPSSDVPATDGFMNIPDGIDEDLPFV